MLLSAEDTEPKERRQTEEAAKRDPLLRSFLEIYDRSYYDRGDDPSFFAAQNRLGDVRKASWGVCRRDVRNALTKGDLVVFFCGSQHERVWCYYFVGFGTVGDLVRREAQWTNPRHAPYRRFYNVLAKVEGGRMFQSETFHHYHDDWKRRAEAPYVLFDPKRSAFNLTSPHEVAIWNGAAVPEKWARDDRSKGIERLLFVERGIDRRLRTFEFGYGHAKLNLVSAGGAARPGRSIPELVQDLKRLV